MSEANVDVVRDVFAAWNAGDLDRLTGLLASDFEFVPFRSQLDGAPYLGAEGVRQFARDAEEEWDYIRIASDEFRDAGDQVVMLGRYDARGRASGVDVQFPAAWVARLRGGKLVQLRSYSDRELALEAAGLGDERASSGG